MMLEIDTGCFTLTGTEAAVFTLGLINLDAPQRETRQESKYCAYGTDGVAVSSSVSPSQCGYYDKSKCGNQESW